MGMVILVPVMMPVVMVSREIFMVVVIWFVIMALMAVVVVIISVVGMMRIGDYRDILN